MLNDKRKALRRPIRYTAWLMLEADQLHGCVLSGVSDIGARIDVEDGEKLPDRFLLLLSGNGKAKRKCRVVWRTARQSGVKFDHRFADPAQATLVPELDANVNAAEAVSDPAKEV